MEERRVAGDELLTIAEVAHIFRVDATTVRRWVKNGALEAISLPHVSIRQSYRVRRGDVERILAGNTAK